MFFAAVALLLVGVLIGMGIENYGEKNKFDNHLKGNTSGVNWELRWDGDFEIEDKSSTQFPIMSDDVKEQFEQLIK